MNENEVKIPANTEDPSEHIPESGSKYDYSTVLTAMQAQSHQKKNFQAVNI